MSKVSCRRCDREITKRAEVVEAVRNFGNIGCKYCHEDLRIIVSDEDVMLMPEPHRSNAMMEICY